MTAPTPTTPAARKVLSPGFWGLMVFAALCVAVGVGLSLHFRAAPRSAPPVVAPALLAPVPAAAVPVPSPSVPEFAPAGDRLAAIEARDGRVMKAAGLALAAASIGEAAAGPRPFAPTVEAFAAWLPQAADPGGLAELAGRGAPTRAELAAGLTRRADIAANAAHAPARSAPFMAQLGYAFSHIVSVRRLDARAGGADGVIARAQLRADEGDLEGAIALIQTLTPAARAPLADWLDAAGRRVALDRHVEALRGAALTALAQAEGPPLAGPALAAGPASTAAQP